MNNIGPNIIHAMDLAHLEEMDIMTNGLDEGIAPTGEPNGLYPWQSEALKRLMAMDPKDLELREERQRLKNETFWERYGNSADYIIIDSVPAMAWDENHYFPGIYEIAPFDPDHRDEHDWKRDKFVSGPPTPPSDAKRAKLRAKRKKRK